jgi:2'-5' RNA ligase
MVPLRDTIIHDAMNRLALQVSIPLVSDPHITLALYNCSTDEKLKTVCQILDGIATSKMKISSKGLVCFVRNKKHDIATLTEFPGGQILADAAIRCSRMSDLYDPGRWPRDTKFQRNFHITFKDTRGYLRNPALLESLKHHHEFNFGKLLCHEVHLCKMYSVNGIYDIVHRKRLK